MLLRDALEQTVDGLLVSPGLVPPVLDGRKTVTRRMSAAKWMRRKKGDLLFLRENWRLATWEIRLGIGVRLRYEADGGVSPWLGAPRSWFEREEKRWKDGAEVGPLRPSLLLPRWASRCVLRLTEEPRLERVQEITEEDAKREGVLAVPFYPDDGFPLSTGYCFPPNDGKKPLYPSAREAFSTGWLSLHTKPGERWGDDPTVVRLAFEIAGKA